ncbi:MAG: aldo/keto reductase, partial [Synergistaceae bacterium]|nr:aldo/keto reductase [Synergistaceae bacterium]
MHKISRLGLGCMGMSISRTPEKSIRTVHKAINEGITLLNTGNFYNGGESETLLGQALKGIPRDKYFLSVKFGVLFGPSGQIYGLDVSPFRIGAQLNYSLHRLGLQYIDLYQPARMDSSIPIEGIMEVMVGLKEKGYIRNIGLT